jgi:hypothetical protein
LAEGRGLREGWDSKELWESVEKLKAPPFAGHERRVGSRGICRREDKGKVETESRNQKWEGKGVGAKEELVRLLSGEDNLVRGAEGVYDSRTF